MKQPSGKRRGPGRPFQKGQSGNPKGRPPAGWSFAEMIRNAGTPARQQALADVLWGLATEPHGDVNARLKAIDLIGRHGWPTANRETTTVTADGPATISVVHELHPSAEPFPHD